MLTKEGETLQLLNRLPKDIITINSFSGGIQAGITVAEHVNECRFIKWKSYYMYHKTPEHALKS